MAQVQLNPTIELTPYQKYQQALLKYQAQNPQLNAQYETYGVAPPAPTQTGPLDQGAKIAATLAAKKAGAALASQFGGASAATAAGQTAGTAGASIANAGAGIGLKGSAAAAQAGSTPGITTAGTLGAMAPLLAAGVAAYTAKEGYDAYKNSKGGFKGGIQGWKDSSPLVKYNPVLAWAPFAGGLLGHKSTKQYQREKWGELANSASIPTQNYANSYLDYLKSDQAGIDAQYPNTFEGKKEAGTLRAEDVWGGHGMFKTFGDDWLGKYTEDQRRAVSNALLANDLIRTSKGDQYITDEAKAKELAANSIQALLAKPVNNPNSPGFKDGKRINLGTR